MRDLRFGGSIWCNVDVALRSLNNIYKQELGSLELVVIECYVLESLYKQDGQMASQLANAVGRPATSFTPILDSLETKGWIERQRNPSDRRSVKIHLTDKAKNLQYKMEASVQNIESKIRQQFSDKQWRGWQNAIARLQVVDQ